MKNQIFYLILSLLFFLSCQERPAVNQEQLEEYFEVQKPKAMRIEDRFKQEFEMMVDPATGTVPTERLLVAKAIADQRRLERLQQENLIPIFWEERGPNNVGGRTRAILFDSRDPTQRTVWAAGVSGGLWKTNNIEASDPGWEKINDLFDNLAIVSIVQDPIDPNIMYFGTGEAFAFPVQGLGVWKSTDGGMTWGQLPSTNGVGQFFWTSRMVMDQNGTLFIGTLWGGLQRYNPVSDTWTPVQSAAVDNRNWISDIELAANGDMYIAFVNDEVRRWDAVTNTWSVIMNGLPDTLYSRIELACAPSDPDVVYAIFEKTGCVGVFRTDDRGAQWNQVPSNCPGSLGDQTGYDLILAVDPNDPDFVWVGAVNIFNSTNAGGTWRQISGLHVDHHALIYRPGSSDHIVFGNDGGIYFTDNGKSASPNPDNKNTGYNVTQFYSLALHPDPTSNYMLGGTQDNSVRKFNSAGIGSTSCEVCCCDGAFTFISQSNPDIQIVSRQNSGFRVSMNGSSGFSTVVPANDDRHFITPADYDDDANILYYSDVREKFGRLIIDPPLTNVSTETVAEFDSLRPSAVTACPNIPHRVYFGVDSLLIRVDSAHDAGNIIVTPLTMPTPNLGNAIRCIEVEDGNKDHLLVVYPNFGIQNIWESKDGGSSWTSVDGDLPDMPVRWILFHPFDSSQALVATDVGVWSTEKLDGANTEWYPTNYFGLANVRVDMLQIRKTDYLVGAATHGRGIFTTDYFKLLMDCPPNLILSGNIPSGLYMASEFIRSDGSVNPEEKVIFHAGDEILLQPNFEALFGSDFWALIRPCETKDLFKFPDPMADRVLPSPIPGSEVWAKPRQAAEEEEVVEVQEQNLVFQAYPNPTDFLLLVDYNMPESGYLSAYVRDSYGRKIQVLINKGYYDKGQYRVRLDASTLPKGLYFLTFEYKGKRMTDKFFVVK